MEYCDGGDLSSFIHKRRRLPESVCRKFLQQLALALKFLRQNNVCHLDLKPQNLLLVTQPSITLKVAGTTLVLSTWSYLKDCALKTLANSSGNMEKPNAAL